MKIELCDLCSKDVSKAESRIIEEAGGFAGCRFLFFDGFHIHDGKLKDGAIYHVEQSGNHPYAKAFWVRLVIEPISEEGVSICMRCHHAIAKKVMALWTKEAKKTCKCSLPENKRK